MKVLSKSRFKLGLECPNKLFFTGKKEFANKKDENPFLKALASGGFQVEELARLHFPEGILIKDVKKHEEYDYEELAEKTNKLLEQENVVLFEAAFLFENLFVRTDILVKKGNQIKLIEVKAKSINSQDKNLFLNKSDKIESEWKPYLFDIAFQKHVIEKSFPKFNVTPYLMLADKSKFASIDGLNQHFRIVKNADDRTGIKIVNKENLVNLDKESVLSIIKVADEIRLIEEDKERLLNEYSFYESISELSKKYVTNEYFNYPLPFNACKKCEFKKNKESKEDIGKKSGFEHCWSKQMNWTKNEFEAPNAFEIWNLHHTKYNTFQEQGKILLKDISDEEFAPKKPSKKSYPGMTPLERQIIQKEKSITKNNEIIFLKEELIEEMNTWKFPLNFIDFETSMVALPYYKGQKPYEQVAFQFSHHIFHEDGTIEHANEYINLKPGVFPNFEFVYNLKTSLEKNTGSIFMFSNHENTVLNQIQEQLIYSNFQTNIYNKAELIEFIENITILRDKQNKDKIVRKGERVMIDLCQTVKDYYYNPYTKGSNSIKDVLPSIFKTSKFIIDKYSKPLGSIKITSKHFDDNKIWILMDENQKVIDPYKSLPKPHKDYNNSYQLIGEIDEINNGGAALTAYGKTQYTDMDEMERNDIKEALLRYCELDTLAMVMIYEHFKEICE
jgi:hypothetical protein